MDWNFLKIHYPWKSYWNKKYVSVHLEIVAYATRITKKKKEEEKEGLL